MVCTPVTVAGKGGQVRHSRGGMLQLRLRVRKENLWEKLRVYCTNLVHIGVRNESIDEAMTRRDRVAVRGEGQGPDGGVRRDDRRRTPSISRAPHLRCA